MPRAAQANIAAISLERRQVVLDDGVIIPITNMFDVCGCETDDPDEADSFVAGPRADGKWVVDATANYTLEKQ